ncbi:MAG: hypothetical protein KKA07_02150 [Bacteroidetes bacterium]|nr:hypothetical protein [Bacteroidota bacterium]MBU1717852.1 hypothetical protein [Bacteroidota bacterium]
MKISGGWAWIATGLIILSSCQGVENSNETTDDNMSFSVTPNDTLSENEAIVYVLPSPLQVSSILELLNVKYDGSLIIHSGQPKSYGTASAKAMNLGITIIDLGYASVFNDLQSHSSKVDEVTNLMGELGLPAPTEIPEINSSKILMKDESLKKSGMKFLKEIERHFTMAEDKKIAFMVMSGLFVEGLYLITETYDAQLAGNYKSLLVKNSFENLMLQHQVFLENLQELLAPYQDDKEVEILLAYFNLLYSDFQDVNISYFYDSIEKRIVDISLNRNEIKKVADRIKVIRNQIINRS